MKKTIGISVLLLLLLLSVTSSVEAKPLALSVLSYASKHVPKQAGTYRFMSKGKAYIGRSNNLHRRVLEHLRSGKLEPKNLTTFRHATTGFTGGVLNSIEKGKIRVFDVLTKGKLANKVHAPLSRARAKR